MHFGPDRQRRDFLAFLGHPVRNFSYKFVRYGDAARHICLDQRGANTITLFGQSARSRPTSRNCRLSGTRPAVNRWKRRVYGWVIMKLSFISELASASFADRHVPTYLKLALTDNSTALPFGRLQASNSFTHRSDAETGVPLHFPDQVTTGPTPIECPLAPPVRSASPPWSSPSC
jgi:hypothetical protein